MSFVLVGCSKPELDQDPNDSSYYKSLSLNYQEAVTKLDDEIRQHPQAILPEYFRALVEVEKGNLQYGIARLDQLLQKHPKYSFGYSQRCRAYFKAGNYEQALADGDLAIRFRPDVGRNYVRRAMVELLVHQPDAAYKDLQTATRLAPNEDPNFTMMLTGVALMDMRRYDEALSLLNKAVENGKKDSRTYVRRATCYAFMKDWSKAKSDSDKAIKLAPDDVNAQILHAALLSQSGHRDAARAAFQSICKKTRDPRTLADGGNLGPDVPSIADIAFACLANHDHKLAKAVLTRAQSLRPLDNEEVFALAKAELANADFFRAAKLLNECLATQPTWAEPRVELIKLYVRDNLPQKAKEVQREGLDLPLAAKDKSIVSRAI